MCETGGEPNEGRFYDAKTRRGAWAFMCPLCFQDGKIGLNRLGVGMGQEYTFEPESQRWVKTGG
jgi:hypothetical protein